MRVLIAIDGSAPSDRARELAGSIRWPAGTVLRLVSVVQEHYDLFAMPGLAVSAEEAEEVEAPRVAAAQTVLDAAALTLASPGVTVETGVILGRPATELVEEAARFAADLVIVGSRGHGTLSSMLLGSVSEEVVDGAGCPVLVARRGAIATVLLGEDGSTGAAHAHDLVATWPIFTDAAITVASASDVAIPWSLGMVPDVDATLLTTYEDAAQDDLDARRTLVADAVARLRAAGRHVTGVLLRGDPAATLIHEANDRGVDLVVVGSRGQTGVTRLVLGSVARNVLHHVHCSVLIVRATARVMQPDAPASEPVVAQPVG